MQRLNWGFKGKEPLTFGEWRDYYGVETKYQLFHDEYGDLAGSLLDYEEIHYRDYLDNFSPIE